MSERQKMELPQSSSAPVQWRKPVKSVAVGNSELAKLRHAAAQAA